MSRNTISSSDPSSALEAHSLPAATSSWELKWPPNKMADDIASSYWPGPWQSEQKGNSGKNVSVPIYEITPFKEDCLLKPEYYYINVTS